LRDIQEQYRSRNASQENELRRILLNRSSWLGQVFLYSHALSSALTRWNAPFIVAHIGESNQGTEEVEAEHERIRISEAIDELENEEMQQALSRVRSFSCATRNIPNVHFGVGDTHFGSLDSPWHIGEAMNKRIKEMLNPMRGGKMKGVEEVEFSGL